MSSAKELEERTAAKFREIVELVRAQDPTVDAEGEAEQLIEDWMEAEDEGRPREVTTQLQLLLSEHHQISEQLWDALVDGEDG